MDYRESFHNREPIRNRLWKFMAFVSAVAAVALVVIVTQRLSNDSLALLVGLVCGVIAMVPALGLAWLVLRRELARQQLATRQQIAMRQPSSALQGPTNTPPIIVVTPQVPALPGYNSTPTAAVSQAIMPWQTASSGRTFTVVGGEERA